MCLSVGLSMLVLFLLFSLCLIYRVVYQDLGFQAAVVIITIFTVMLAWVAASFILILVNL